MSDITTQSFLQAHKESECCNEIIGNLDEFRDGEKISPKQDKELTCSEKKERREVRMNERGCGIYCDEWNFWLRVCPQI